MDHILVRIPASLKQVFQRAAALQGQTLTDFVLSATTEAARRVIRENEVLDLSRRDQLAFAEALITPPAASPRLAEAARRYRNGHDQ